MKPYKLKALQPNFNVKQVINIGHGLKLQKSIIKTKYIEEPKSNQKLNLMFQELRINIKHVDELISSQKLKLGL